LNAIDGRRNYYESEILTPNRWRGKIIKEDKANALQSLTIGYWLNVLTLR